MLMGGLIFGAAVYMVMDRWVCVSSVCARAKATVVRYGCDEERVRGILGTPGYANIIGEVARVGAVGMDA